MISSDDKIIIACSSSRATNAAIAVIRLSGFKKVTEFQKFFKKNLDKIQERKMYFSQITSDESILDEVCFCFFKGPESYNGENILEIFIHGNLLNIDKIINLFLNDPNIREANPGEFTLRALKNKKLTLSQVEGLDLFLNANTHYSLDQGLSLLNGELHQSFLNLHHLYLKHKSSLELLIDFSDDVGEESALKLFNDTRTELFSFIEKLNLRAINTNLSLINPKIVLLGEPNAGKSTLFNSLLNKERSIVSPIQGTTRDYIEDDFFIKGNHYKLVDTAGLRETDDIIEKIGINYSKEFISSAFFKILLLDSRSQDLIKIDFSHVDLIIITHENKIQFSIPSDIKMITIDARNLNEIQRQDILDRVNEKYLQLTKDKPIIIDRHKKDINKLYLLMSSYIKSTTYESDVGIISHEIRILESCISDLIGIVSPDQVLNSIFSNFCIGK
jgi:tRNA modification GTPase